jgi:hypothetical protein
MSPSSSAQQSSLNIQFSPNNAPLKAGEQKIVKLTLSSDQPISAFDLKFQTSGGISIVNFENNIGFDKNFDPFNLKQVINEVNGSNSRLSYILNAPSANLPAKIDLYLSVKGTITGESKITIDYNNSQVLSSTGNLLQINPTEAAFNINRDTSSPEFINPADLPKFSYPQTSALVNLRLKLLDTINPPSISNIKGIAVAVGRVGESKFETQPQPFNLTPNSDGTFSGTAAFPDFKDGTKFSLMIKVDKYLLKRICDVAPTESNPGQYTCVEPSLTIRRGENSFDFSGINLLSGDLGQPDGVLNGYDLSIIRNNLNKNTREAALLADLNYDGLVDEKDLSIIKFVAGNTGRKADQ